MRCTECYANIIMDNATSLGGKSDEEGGFKYYVKRSMPESQRATHDKYAAQMREYRSQNMNAKSEEDLVNYYISQDKLIVDGAPVPEDVTPPSLLDMIEATREENDKMMHVEFYSSMPKEV